MVTTDESGTARPTRVFLVDDQALVRGGFRMLIEAEDDLEVVGEAGDGQEALSRLRTVGADVVLMDVRMPVLDGVETTAAIGKACPETAVVVLTATAESEEIDALYGAGAVACLTKDRELDDIVGAVRDAAGRDAALR